MKLMSINEWAATYFTDDSRPAELTILRLLREGKLPGRKVGGKWFIDVHTWLAGDDELVNRVLSG